MALALSLPTTLVYREEILITTFGVVLFTLLVSGTSIEPLVKILRMNVGDPKLDAYKELKGLQMSNAKALNFLENLRRKGSIAEPTYNTLREEIALSQAKVRDDLEELHLADSSIQELELRETKRTLLEMRKDHIVLLYREGLLEQESLDKLRLKFDQDIGKLSE